MEQGIRNNKLWKELEELEAEIDRRLKEDPINRHELPPGTKYVEIGNNGLRKIYGIAKARDFQNESRR